VMLGYGHGITRVFFQGSSFVLLLRRTTGLYLERLFLEVKHWYLIAITFVSRR
jgi:hypothetical protein